ncbi:MAG: alpha/beta fold hydrolase [Caldilineaceae bacterium]
MSSAIQPAERHAFQHDDRTYGYLLYRPAATVGQETPRPLILFLRPRRVRRRSGTGQALRAARGAGTGRRTPALVIAPQCPADSDWEAQTANLAALLDDVCAREQVDTARVYLTGLSMGGRGSWLLALAHPARFAAVACMANRIPFAIRPTPDFTPLRTMPIWVFHGARSHRPAG